MRVHKTKREGRNRIGIEIKYIISLDRPLRFGSSDSATENKERKKKKRDNRTKKASVYRYLMTPSEPWQGSLKPSLTRHEGTLLFLVYVISKSCLPRNGTGTVSRPFATWFGWVLLLAYHLVLVLV